VVVADGVTAREEPAPSLVPPHEPEYQFHVAPVPSAPPEIVRFEVEPGQTEAALALAEIADVDKEFTVIFALTHVVVLHVPEART
jgi:hypothetical protein